MALKKNILAPETPERPDFFTVQNSEAVPCVCAC